MAVAIRQKKTKCGGYAYAAGEATFTWTRTLLPLAGQIAQDTARPVQERARIVVYP